VREKRELSEDAQSQKRSKQSRPTSPKVERSEPTAVKRNGQTPDPEKQEPEEGKGTVEAN